MRRSVTQHTCVHHADKSIASLPYADTDKSGSVSFVEFLTFFGADTSEEDDGGKVRAL